MVGEDLIGPLFAHGAHGAELAVVEGVMGLYDGRTGAGETGSTAQVAALLDAPVILVVDAAAQGRSIAALVHGFRSFGTVRLAGVILNPSGQPASGFKVILRDVGSNLQYTSGPTDAAGNSVFYVKQKLFKLKENIQVFRDESQSQLLFTIQADRIIDWSAKYHIRDTAGNELGAVRRHGMKSMWRAVVSGIASMANSESIV